MPRSMSYAAYLAIPPEYRGVQHSPHCCTVLELEPGAGTVSVPVSIVGDYVGKVGRATRDGYLAVTARMHSIRKARRIAPSGA